MALYLLRTKTKERCSLVIMMLFLIFNNVCGQTQSNLIKDTSMALEYESRVQLTSAGKDSSGNSPSLVNFGSGLSLYSFSSQQTVKNPALWDLVWQGSKDSKKRGVLYSGDFFVLQNADLREYIGLSQGEQLISQKEKPADTCFYSIAQSDFNQAVLNSLLKNKIDSRTERKKIKIQDQFYLFVVKRSENSLDAWLLSAGAGGVTPKKVISYSQASVIQNTTDFVKDKLESFKDKAENLWSASGVSPRMILTGDAVCIRSVDDQLVDQYLAVRQMGENYQVTTSKDFTDDCLWQVMVTFGLSGTQTLTGNVLRLRYGSMLTGSFMLRHKTSGLYLYTNSLEKNSTQPTHTQILAKTPFFNTSIKRFDNQSSYEWFADDMITNQPQTFFQQNTRVKLISKESKNVLFFSLSNKPADLVELSGKPSTSSLPDCFWWVQKIEEPRVIQAQDFVFIRHIITGDYLTVGQDNLLLFDKKELRSRWRVQRSLKDITDKSSIKTKDTVVFIHEDTGFVIYPEQISDQGLFFTIKDSTKETLDAKTMGWVVELGRAPETTCTDQLPLRLFNQTDYKTLTLSSLDRPRKARLISQGTEMTDKRANDFSLLCFEYAEARPDSPVQTPGTKTGDNLTNNSGASIPAQDKKDTGTSASGPITKADGTSPSSGASGAAATPVDLAVQFTQEVAAFMEKGTASDKIAYAMTLLPKYNANPSPEAKKHCAGFIYKLFVDLDDMTPDVKAAYKNLIYTIIDGYRLVDTLDYSFISTNMIPKLLKKM